MCITLLKLIENVVILMQNIFALTFCKKIQSYFTDSFQSLFLMVQYADEILEFTNAFVINCTIVSVKLIFSYKKKKLLSVVV